MGMEFNDSPPPHDLADASLRDGEVFGEAVGGDFEFLEKVLLEDLASVGVIYRNLVQNELTQYVTNAKDK